ncbi:response regulator transcription factor [Enterococcus sp.]|uniref:response regulator transcription factor n=1 Tax=Enterococcus sp. TaxID=35783 RepID=UPI002FCC4204
MKIMIIEDEPTIQKIIGDTIEKWGMTPILVEQFDQIFQIFLEESPHLVLMDINLPTFDGFYWCQKIREVSKVPILFLSSRNTSLDMVMAMNMGADDFINKPFDLEVLMAKINALLRRTYDYAENIEVSILEHRGLLLNLSTHELSFENQKIELSKTEMGILQLLMRNKGIVVSRHKIMRSLWADERFVDENTLTVNITRIRKKINELGLEQFITTKKGHGYIIL